MPQLIGIRENQPVTDIVARTVDELVRRKQLPYEMVIVNEENGDKFHVQIRRTEKETPKHLREHRTFIVVGPAGSPCRCCGGSGREEGE